jgi:large subunit ribosomal protein L4
MELKIYELGSSKELGKLEVSDSILLTPVRPDIIKRVIEWQLLKRMSGTHNARTVSEISGTGKKPFKQKGTGKARQGSLRSVQMRGGAQAHGPSPRSHAIKLQKKVRMMGLCSALSDRFADKKMLVVDNLAISSSKTKDLMSLLAPYKARSFFVVGDQELNENFKKASSNLHNVSVVASQGLNVYDIIKHEYLIMTKEAMINIEKRLVNA